MGETGGIGTMVVRKRSTVDITITSLVFLHFAIAPLSRRNSRSVPARLVACRCTVANSRLSYTENDSKRFVQRNPFSALTFRCPLRPHRSTDLLSSASSDAPDQSDLRLSPSDHFSPSSFLHPRSTSSHHQPPPTLLCNSSPSSHSSPSLYSSVPLHRLLLPSTRSSLCIRSRR